MYNDTIKVANKIITDKDLLEIFELMNEKLIYLKKIAKKEEMQNSMLKYDYKKWTFKDNGSKLSFDVDFYDDTNIKFDNYNNFLAIFNSRLHEIKNIWVRFHLWYSVSSPSQKYEWHSQYINMNIYETKADIEVSLSSTDKKIDDIYELIKNKILNAPPKYDTVVKEKTKINIIVGLGIGFIPALIITTLLLLIPAVKYVFAESYVLYTICCLALTFFIGEIAISAKLDDLYKNIIPEKKYIRYDSTTHKSVYKDDIDNYIQTSEILIGKNVDNLKCRDNIMKYYNKYKRYIPYEIVIMILLSVISVLLGKL